MRIMKVKNKHVKHDANGTSCLKYVMRCRFIKNNYTHVQLGSNVYSDTIWFTNNIQTIPDKILSI